MPSPESSSVASFLLAVRDQRLRRAAEQMRPAHFALPWQGNQRVDQTCDPSMGRPFIAAGYACSFAEAGATPWHCRFAAMVNATTREMPPGRHEARTRPKWPTSTEPPQAAGSTADAEATPSVDVDTTVLVVKA